MLGNNGFINVSQIPKKYSALETGFIIHLHMFFSRMPFLSLSLGVGAKLPSTETSTFLSIRSVSEVENEMSYL